MKYDIGLVVILNYNYGNNLTNYALFHYLKNLKFKVLLIDAPVKIGTIMPAYINDKMGLFTQNPYGESEVANSYCEQWEVLELNNICDMFMVGSDQLWRAQMFLKKTNYYPCLDWVFSNKYKMSYATSIGMNFFDGDTNLFVSYLRRFQKISVREKSAVELLENIGGIHSEWVMDPIFLLQKDEYLSLANCGRMKFQEKCYIAAYLLDRDVWKERVALDISEALNCSDVIGMTDVLDSCIQQDYIHYETDAKVEDWINAIYYSRYFVTDSFHGVCMALILNKPFIVVFNENSFRGSERLHSLLEFVGLSNRMISDDIEKVQLYSLLENEIDMEQVKEKLNFNIIHSKKWLNLALEERTTYTHYDAIYDRDLIRRYLNLEKQKADWLNRVRNNHKVWLEQFENDSKVVQFIGWGLGGFFQSHISKIVEISNLNQVCDANEKKWGENYSIGVRCISPDELLQISNPVVLIIVENTDAITSIKEQLYSMGIKYYFSYKEWIEVIDDDRNER